MIPYSLNPMGINTDVALTDLDILRQIRDANPASQLPNLWLDSEDPYTKWEGVVWRDNRVVQLGDLQLGYRNILSLMGVSMLKELEVLDCQRNAISELALKDMVKLRYLGANYNNMVNLTLEGLAALTQLIVPHNLLVSIPTLTSKGLITNYDFTYNNFPTTELNRFRAMGFTDESKLLPQNP